MGGSLVTLVGHATSFNPGGTGVLTELPHTRRILPLQLDNLFYFQYGSDTSGDLTIGVQYSLDSGTTWDTLIPQGPETLANTVQKSDWVSVPAGVQTTEFCMIRAVGSGTHRLVLPYTIYFLELLIQ